MRANGSAQRLCRSWQAPQGIDIDLDMDTRLHAECFCPQQSHITVYAKPVAQWPADSVAVRTAALGVT